MAAVLDAGYLAGSSWVREIARPRTAIVREYSSPCVGLQSKYFLESTQPEKVLGHSMVFVDGQLIRIHLSAPQAFKAQGDIYSHTTTVTDRLNRIKDNLGLSITQIAELFGVTRKSVYDWYEGSEPRANTMSRMDVLIDVISEEQTQKIDLKRLKAVWGIAVSGHSFRAIFNEDNLDTATLRSELVAKLHELSPRMATQTGTVYKSAAKIGDAHLAEFDRGSGFI